MHASGDQSRTIRRAVKVRGIVQGVGFRPYVYRLATERRLSGLIRNTVAGVDIEVQGEADAVVDFLQRLPQEAPPLARITDLTVRDLACGHDESFRIVASQPGAQPRVLISPDVAICDECLRELFDPHDRRYRYPFINCTNCGPRYSILRGIPYDRALTSMSVFPMCPACRTEYEDPADRRFHAQPNACWNCGPSVEITDNAGGRMSAADPFAAAAAEIEAGAIIAVKGLGGFHLACDATNREAVARLRERKRRVEKPFALMAPSLQAIEAYCEVDEPSRALLARPERPIVLLRRKPHSDIADGVAPFNRYLGVFLAYTPMHHLLLAAAHSPTLVMTSGNLSEEPIAIGNEEALERLRGLADYFLLHNRDILLRSDDSVVRVVQGRVRQLRRSRSYVPAPLFLHKEVPPVLAVGGELKNTICLTRGSHAFLSQHIGDLENLESYRFFEEVVSHLKRILEIEPRVVAHDLHPDYFSTRWALRQTGVKLVGVQHHHAHVAACMAENHLDGRVIGVALDGTGFGPDGNIWGGEILLASYGEFERAAHLNYVPMPGGERAIHEPWRMAVSYLHHHFGQEFLEFDIPFVRQLERRKVKALLRMAERGVNAPLTSSCGRLFDAVAALAGIRGLVNYEAQAAIELEMAIDGAGDGSAYPLALNKTQSGWEIGTNPLFQALLKDITEKTPVSVISRRFHNGLVDVIARLAALLRESANLKRVCLTGGAFQNTYLLTHLTDRLEAGGFEVFTHSEVPAGDGGLSLGQAMIAAH